VLIEEYGSFRCQRSFGSAANTNKPETECVCVCVCERERERAGSEESVKHALICSCFIPLQSGEANVSSAPPVGFPRLGNVKGQRAV